MPVVCISLAVISSIQNLHLTAITVTICVLLFVKIWRKRAMFSYILFFSSFSLFYDSKKIFFSALMSIIQRCTDSVVMFNWEQQQKKIFLLIFAQHLPMVIRWVLKPLTVLFIREYFKWKSYTSQKIVDLLWFVCRCSMLIDTIYVFSMCTMYI